MEHRINLIERSGTCARVAKPLEEGEGRKGKRSCPFEEV
jgi:hypothetical protein